MGRLYKEESFSIEDTHIISKIAQHWGPAGPARSYDEFIYHHYHKSLALNRPDVYYNDLMLGLIATSESLENKTLVDIGALVGMIYRQWAYLVPNKIIAIDPTKLAADVYADFCKAHDNNVTFLNIAASNHNRKTEFTEITPGEFTGFSGIFEHDLHNTSSGKPVTGKLSSVLDFLNMKFTKNTNIFKEPKVIRYPVQCNTLDNILKDEINNVGLIKIDVEGHEGFIINGAKQVLQNSRPFMLCEIYPDELEKTFKLLEDLEYGVCDIYGFDIYNTEHNLWCDWFFYPKEKQYILEFLRNTFVKKIKPSWFKATTKIGTHSLLPKQKQMSQIIQRRALLGVPYYDENNPLKDVVRECNPPYDERKNLIPSNTFCLLPWTHMYANPNGELAVCCNSSIDSSINLIKRKDGTPYKIYDKDNPNIDPDLSLMAEAWNSPTYQKLRLQMLRGEKPDMCSLCYSKEDAGHESIRTVNNDSRDIRWFQNVRLAVLPIGNVKWLDLRLGNLCNLKCRMCGPWSSNQWLDEMHLLDDSYTKQDPNKALDKWPEKNSVWNNLKPLISQIEEIYVVGGEPTLILDRYKLYDMCIEQNVAQNITLVYNTNITNIPKKAITYWKQFKHVQLNASIDAYGELNHYIRYPSKWKSIDKNLRTLLDMKMDVTIQCVVQMYNIFHLDKLIEYANELNCPLSFSILQRPDYLNIQILRPHLKQIVEEKLNECDKIFNITGMSIDMEDIKTYMHKREFSHTYPKFLEKTRIIDQSRNQNLFAVVPEFKL